MPTYNHSTEILTLNQHVEPESFVALVQQKGISKYDEAKVRRIAYLINEWGKIFSIPSIFVGAQILEETGYFSFTGDVRPEQNNYAGIGTTGGGVPGHSFKSESAGVLAVYLHHSVYLRGEPHFWHESIRQYATTENNPRLPVVIEAVKRLGVIRKIGDYGNGRWAADPHYASKILAIMNLLKVEGERVAEPYRLRVDHIPWNNPNRSRLASLPSGRGWITIHETGNPNRGMGAWAHRNFTHNGGGEWNVSFNYVLDDTEVIELVPRGERTWQASDGRNGPGNSSVSIEVCINVDGNWAKTKENLAHFIVYLLKNDSELSRSRITQHNRWAPDNKNCPMKLRANNNREYNEVLARVDELMKVPVAPKEDPNALLVNKFWIVNEIYHKWKKLDEETLPMIGYPVSMMFEGPVGTTDDNAVVRLVQLFERGALAVYPEGAPDGVPVGHPFRVRNLTPAERAYVLEWGKENGYVGPHVT